MFGTIRRSPVSDILPFQKEFDRLFAEFWTELPTRTASSASPSFHVNATDDAWCIDVPMPGIDPQYINLDVTGTTVNVRVEPHGEWRPSQTARYEQAFAVPEFLDLDRITASHRHGMLQLTLPLKDSVKPRRIAIEAAVPLRTNQLEGAACAR